MCGYVGKRKGPTEEEIPYWREYSDMLRLPFEQMYMRQKVSQLVTMEEGEPKASEAIWWYMLKREDGKLSINEKVTSFNARNLESNMWKKAVRERRAILFGTEIGESKGQSRYLMESQKVFPLGCVYNDWENDRETVRSFAVITRPPHPRFSKYHDKSMPLFLPSEPDFLNEWLDPNVEVSAAISDVLEYPQLRVSFDVTPVKTYKRGEPLGETEALEKD